MKPLLATIDRIYELYSKKTYGYFENDIINSSILLAIKANGIKDEQMKELRIKKLLKVYDSNVYSILNCHDLQEFWNNPITLLKIYEYMAGKKSNKKEKYSIFYTPEWIVKNMVDNSMKRIFLTNKLENIRVLEPACGCGAFLLCLFDSLFELYLEKTNYSNEEICKIIIENNLYGIDIDSKAIEICKYLLMIKALNRTGKLYFYNFKLFTEDFLVASSIDKNFFDLILGNPPYLENRGLNKYYDKEYLKKKFTTAVGRFDIYSLFIENSISFLKKGGYMSFILPGNLLSNNNFAQTRKYILDNSSITSIINLGEEIFEDVGMSVIIISMHKDRDKANELIMCRNISGSEDKKKDIEVAEYKEIPQRFYENTLLNVFDIDSSYDTFRLREKIYNSCSLIINDAAEVVAGIATGNIRKKLLTKEEDTPNAKKVLEGKNVHKFYHKWSGLYFIDDKRLIDRKKGEYATFMRSDMIYKEKLIIRQTADRFICSYDDDKYYILNTLYSLVIRNDYESVLDIKYILALLNSKLYYFLYSTLIREKGKLFPQLKIFHIQYSPICIPHKSEQQKIGEAVDEIRLLCRKMNMRNNMDGHNVCKYKEKKELLESLLDEMIFKIYGLTAQEIEVINNEIK
ncbi:N-6 DNA methylase [Proteiniborus sp.]|uniref:Eco57I restriction-modification methylase domain-containing protein n=1 Tax=Proteiniborus sp. TaxID=2079015 RepID=UPI00332F68B5